MIIDQGELVTKGASEIIVEACSSFHSKSQGVVPIDQQMKERIYQAIEGMAE